MVLAVRGPAGRALARAKPADRQVLIENHRGVTQYSREQVGVKVAFGEILLCGRELVLARMGPGQLVVTGCVESIRLLRGRCP